MKSMICSRLVKPALAALSLATLWLSAQSGSAQTFAAGDVFISVGNGQVEWRQPDGTLTAVLDTFLAGGQTTGLGFNPGGNLYVAIYDFHEVYGFDSSGALLGPFGAGYDNPESIDFDAAGQGYIGNVGGIFVSPGITVVDPNGLPLAIYPAAGRVDRLDLAADEQTVFYTQGGREIRRFDLATATPLADFAVLPGPGTASGLRLLPDGGLLVADEFEVKRLDASGTVVQTYDVPAEDGWIDLDLAPDGTSFWAASASTSEIYRIDLNSGAVITQFNTGSSFNSVLGLRVFPGSVPPPPPNQPPQIECTATTILLQCPGPATVSASVSDPDGDELTYSIIVDGQTVQSGTVSGPAVLSVTQSFSQGGHTVEFKVTDGTDEAQCSTTVTVADDNTKPVVSCLAGPNPGGNTPKASDKNKFDLHPDGFVQLTADDNCGGTPQIYVADSGSSFVAGPFPSGVQIQFTQAPGAEPRIKLKGNGPIYEIRLRGDALVYAVDASGNVSDPIRCQLPPGGK